MSLRIFQSLVSKRVLGLPQLPGIWARPEDEGAHHGFESGLLHRTTGKPRDIEGVNFMIDGTVDNGSAWLHEPDCYGEGWKSIWTDPDAYCAALSFYAERNISTATHATGDQGVKIEAIIGLSGSAKNRLYVGGVALIFVVRAQL